jgi:hypothetical protein
MLGPHIAKTVPESWRVGDGESEHGPAGGSGESSATS